MSHANYRTPPIINTNQVLSIDTHSPGRTLCKDAVDLLNRKQLSPYQEHELQRYIDNHLHVVCVCDAHGKDSGKGSKSPTSHSDLLKNLRENPYGSPRKEVSWFDDLRSRSLSPGRYGRSSENIPEQVDMYTDGRNGKSIGEGDGLECRTIKWGGKQRVIRPDDPVPRTARASSLPLSVRTKKLYYSPIGDGVDSTGVGDPNDVAFGRGRGSNNAYPDNGYGSDDRNGYGQGSPNGRGGSGGGGRYGNGGHSPSGYGGHSPSGYGGHSPSGYGRHSPSGYGRHSPSGYGGHSPSGYRNGDGGYENGHGGMGSRNGFGGSQPLSEDDNDVPLSYRHGYNFDKARNAYITNPRALIHEFATKTAAPREANPSPMPSPRPNSQAGDYNFAPYPPYRVGSAFDPKKFVKQVRDDGLTHSQKSANRNLEPVHKSPLPQSIHQLKAIAAKKGTNIPGTKEIDFLTGCMLHNLYTGKGAAAEIWE